jgi:hypothetical protein
MISTKSGPADDYASIQGMDPRADWVFGPGRQDYLPYGDDTLIPFIINLQDEAGFNFIQHNFLQDESLSPIYISPFYADKLRAGGLSGEYFVAIATKGFFDELAQVDGVYEALRTAKKKIRLGAPFRTPALQNWKPNDPIPRLGDPPVGPPDRGWPPETVVVGVIDDGIAFAHERFRTAADRSRVQCFWRMDPPDESPGVDFGKEICKEGANGIDALLLASSTAAGSVDEDRFYRAAGLIDFAEPGHKAAAWRIAHGTHVLDLAAGEDRAANVANRPIICVQLPTATTADTSGGDLADRVLLAVDYILERADAMAGAAGQLPVVINFSYGLIAGPHDGTSELEQALNDRILARPDKLQIVLPAGNSHLSRCHAAVRFAALDEVVDLHWRVQPDDQTPSFLEIWLPHEGALPPAAHRVRLSVVTPGGVETALLGETHGTGVFIENDGEEICAARYRFISSPTERGHFRVELQPTARLQPTVLPDALRIAPPGLWTVRLHNVSLTADQPVQLWIQRDDTPYGYPVRGRQSYFDDPRYVRFGVRGREIEEDSDPEQVASPSDVKRAGLVNAIATGAETIVAGGYLRRELLFARYSAGEPITPTRSLPLDPNFRKPDAALVSDDSKVHEGVIAAGSRSGSLVAINGTSVAAPQLTRWVANQLAAGNPGDRNAVKAQAIVDESGLPATKPPFRPERGGWGRMLRNSAFPRPRYWD